MGREKLPIGLRLQKPLFAKAHDFAGAVENVLGPEPERSGRAASWRSTGSASAPAPQYAHRLSKCRHDFRLGHVLRPQDFQQPASLVMASMTFQRMSFCWLAAEICRESAGRAAASKNRRRLRLWPHIEQRPTGMSTAPPAGRRSPDSVRRNGLAGYGRVECLFNGRCTRAFQRTCLRGRRPETPIRFCTRRDTARRRLSHSSITVAAS